MGKVRTPDELRKMVEEEGYQLNDNEARLLELMEFHQTGKRTERFKDSNKAKPQEPIIHTLTKRDTILLPGDAENRATPILLDKIARNNAARGQ